VDVGFEDWEWGKSVVERDCGLVFVLEPLRRLRSERGGVCKMEFIQIILPQIIPSVKMNRNHAQPPPESRRRINGRLLSAKGSWFGYVGWIRLILLAAPKVLLRLTSVHKNYMRNPIISLLFILIGYSCTDKLTIPVVVTAPVSDIRSTSALCGGTVVSGGGGELLNQGICWSVEKNPTISDNYVYDSIGLSSFSITITGLSPNTSYYLRSFAINSSGTGYGPMVKFTTMGKNVVVLDGDSRTDGWNCEYRYPYIDLLSLKESSVIYKTSFGGLSSEDLITRGPVEVDTKLSNLARMNVVVVWVGVNDIAINDQSADFTFTNLVTYCNERRNKGWKVIVCTEVSMKGQGSNGACDLTRNIYNDLIKTRWQEFTDGIADLASNPEIGTIGAYLNTTYFCDGIHLTNSGTVIVADIVNQAIDTLMSK